MISDEKLKEIALETSSYVHGITGKDVIGVNEICSFIGAVYICDLYPMSDTKRNWGLNHSMYACKNNELKRSIDYDDFVLIKNNLKLPEQDRMYIVNVLKNSLATLFSPSSYISLDETLRKFMGRFKNKHRNTDKPAKEGLKWFVLCDSDVKLPLDFTFHDDNLVESNGLTKIGSMVRQMVVNRPHSILFMDNYFLTHDLLVQMITLNIKIIGTVRANRIPVEVRSLAELHQISKKKRVYNEEEDTVFCPNLCIHCEGVYYVYIVDNKLFTMATNSKDLIDMGYCLVETQFGKKHKNTLKIEKYDGLFNLYRI